MNIVVPTFHREGSLDKYNNSNIINAIGAPDNFTIATVVDKDSELMNLLKNCDETSRPICFETIDVILRNKDADKIVKQLTVWAPEVIILENFKFPPGLEWMSFV